MVVVRHFVALRDESDALVWCNPRKIADSGAVLQSRGSKALRQCTPQPVNVKGAGNQQGVSEPGNFRQRKTVQPVKVVAVKR